MKIMIGCMVETSIGVTAAAHLSPLCDYADLDGPLLIAMILQGVSYENARLVLPTGPAWAFHPNYVSNETASSGMPIFPVDQMMRYIARKYGKPLFLLTLMMMLVAHARYSKCTGHSDASSSTLWQSIASGIDYREFYLTDPNHLYVARMERSNTQVTLESSIGQGRLSGGTETVSQMAERYDQSINYWKNGEAQPGGMAINGYFTTRRLAC
jgi:hypothetical protein